jgi:hydrogenase maturation protease
MIVVAGYGNLLRRDDGVGWRVAEAVAGRWAGHPRARVLMGQQPLPEWAVELARARVAYLVDAAHGARGTQLRRLGAGSEGSDVALLDGHELDAEGLLRLTNTVYGCAPRAYQVLVPAEDFAFGEQLSPRAAAAVASAAAMLDRRLRRHLG